MAELYDEFFAMLRFSKRLCGYGMAERLRDRFDSHPLDGDCYWELAYETIGWVFQNTSQYYNENEEIETWLFADPVIDRFCELCQRYEKHKGISEKDNLYRKDMEQILHEGFSFNSYSYGYNWRLSQKDRGRKCLLLFTGCEFYGHDEIFEGLMEIRYGFETVNKNWNGIFPWKPGSYRCPWRRSSGRRPRNAERL